MDTSVAGDEREVLVRTPIELDPALTVALGDAIACMLQAPVRLKVVQDRRTKGLVIILDPGRQVSVDLVAPVEELAARLTRALGDAGAPGTERAERAREVIAGFEEGPALAAEATNLRRALAGFKGEHVTLKSRVPLDADVLRRLEDKLRGAAGHRLEVELVVDPRLTVGAQLDIGTDKRIVLDGRYTWIDELARSIAEKQRTGTLAPADTGEVIREMIESTEPELRVEAMEDTGAVLEVGDGVALVSGMRGAGSQELVRFENGVFGLAFSLLDHAVGCILLGPEEGLREGTQVRRTGHLMKVPVGGAMSGRIVNALGEPIDDSGPVAAEGFYPAEKKAPGIVRRHPVHEPLHAGIKVIDAMVPLGRGQRELVIGDRKIGKTTLAVDTILSQRDKDVFCVYASIGQKASSVARVVHTLREYGALDYTTVVVALPNEQPAFRYLTPYTACAIGEYFMEQGKHALVVFDDLSKHAVTYRELSALLKRPIGREAYPGDIFYVHSRLLERAARMTDELGGGSLTALPIVETLAGDISAFIPTNVISICDGQIFLDSGLFNEGFRPAMDVGLSVSRVGGAAQRRAMKEVAGRLRIDLAQYQEMAQFVKFGAEVDQATLNQLARGERCRELLKQAQHLPLPMAVEVLVLFAGVNGHLDSIEVRDVVEAESALITYLQASHAALLARIEASGEIDEETEGESRRAIEAFVASWRPEEKGPEGRAEPEPTAEPVEAAAPAGEGA
jgi:F-type H+-transporting ATPase subunit alpha